MNKKPCHGALHARPPMCSYLPGTSPDPSEHRLRLGSDRSATTNPPANEDRGPLKTGGAGEKPAGRRLATDKRHRADTAREASGLPCRPGAGAGGGIVSDRKASKMIEQIIEALPIEGRGHPPLSRARNDQRNYFRFRSFVSYPSLNIKKMVPMAFASMGGCGAVGGYAFALCGLYLGWLA